MTSLYETALRNLGIVLLCFFFISLQEADATPSALSRSPVRIVALYDQLVRKYVSEHSDLGSPEKFIETLVHTTSDWFQKEVGRRIEMAGVLPLKTELTFQSIKWMDDDLGIPQLSQLASDAKSTLGTPLLVVFSCISDSEAQKIAEALERDSGIDRFLGMTPQPLGRMILVKDCRLFTEIIFAHELGHYFGAVHSDDPHSTMFQGLGGGSVAETIALAKLENRHYDRGNIEAMKVLMNQGVEGRISSVLSLPQEVLDQYSGYIRTVGGGKDNSIVDVFVNQAALDLAQNRPLVALNRISAALRLGSFDCEYGSFRIEALYKLHRFKEGLDYWLETIKDGACDTCPECKRNLYESAMKCMKAREQTKVR